MTSHNQKDPKPVTHRGSESHRAQVEEDLRKIYEDDGEMPDLSQLDSRRDSWLTRLLVRTILILLVLSGLAWAGFFIWKPYAQQSERPLGVMVEAPTKAVSGEEIHLRIRYENLGEVPLAALEIKVQLPPDFVIKEARPAPSSEGVWMIGSLPSESDGSIDITGTFRAAVPSLEKIQALYTYRPANFSSDFQDIASATVSIERSVLELAAVGSDKALPGDELSYTLTTTNIGSEPISGARLRAILPETFSIMTSTPAVRQDGVSEWDLPTIEPGATGVVTVTGTFSAQSAGTSTIPFEIGLIDPEGLFLSQTHTDVATDILGGNLAFHLIANGSEEGQSLDLGSVLRLSIDYDNLGSDQLEGITFTLKLTTPNRALPIDWDAAELAGAQRVSGTLVWDASVLPELGILPPSASGVIDLTLPILESLDPTMISDAFTLSLQADIEQIGSVASARTVETTPITFLVNSDAEFFASARYYNADGEPLGTGPLPPTVSETTTYRVFWDATNTLHDLGSVSVTTNLPPDVTWVGKAQTDIGTIVYNDTTRLITWSIDHLPTSVGAVETWFDLAITPEADDVGSFVKLTNASGFEATDRVTDDTVHMSIDQLDTELPFDELAAGKGVVVEAEE